jgi:hypothetical protein
MGFFGKKKSQSSAAVAHAAINWCHSRIVASANSSFILAMLSPLYEYHILQVECVVKTATAVIHIVH